MGQQNKHHLWHKNENSSDNTKDNITSLVLLTQCKLGNFCPIQEVRFVTSDATTIELNTLPWNENSEYPISPYWDNQNITIHPGLTVFRWRETWRMGPQCPQVNACVEFQKVNHESWVNMALSAPSTQRLSRTIGYDLHNASDNTIIITRSYVPKLATLARKQLGMSKTVNVFGPSIRICELYKISLIVLCDGYVKLVREY